LGICSLVIVLIHIICRSVHIWHIRIVAPWSRQGGLYALPSTLLTFSSKALHFAFMSSLLYLSSVKD
jgi:hypothetical protein